MKSVAVQVEEIIEQMAMSLDWIACLKGFSCVLMLWSQPTGTGCCFSSFAEPAQLTNTIDVDLSQV